MMSLRKDRVYHTGTTNLMNSSSKHHVALASPFPGISLESSPVSSPAKSLATSPTKLPQMSPNKSSNVHDIILKKMARSVVSPLEDTATFYKETNKMKKLKAIVSSPRTAQLEEKDKMKMVFTGESTLIYDKKLEKYRGESPNVPNLESPKQADSRKIRSKNTENAQAIQETQLVAVDKFNSKTLGNNVDLEKVREARRVLRRKYANRTNLQKIYSTWDEDNTGVISVQNIFNMSKKLGLHLNFDEARVLLASADKDASGGLSLDEFLDLIYNKDDALNVNLESLTKKTGDDFTIHKEELEGGDNNVLKKLQEDAKKASETRKMNQLRLILKNRVNDLGHAMLEIDPDRTGYVNLFKFEQAVQRLRISENVLSQKDIQDIFEKHRADPLKLDYKDFLKTLKNFAFSYDQEYLDNNSPKTKKLASSATLSKFSLDLSNEPLKIVNCRDLPYNMMMNFHTRSKKVGKAIQRFFPNKEEFNGYLSNKLNLQNGEMEKQYVSGNDFKQIVDDLFNQFDVSNVDRRDLEGFLSSVLYNKHGYTTLKEINHTIYDEDEKQFFDKVQKRKRGPVPHLNIKPHESASPDNNDRVKTETYEADEVEALQTKKSDTHRAELTVPTWGSTRFERASKGSLPSIKLNVVTKEENKEKTNKKLDDGLKKILQQLEPKIFIENKSALKTFKQFDVDGDGYISHTDLVTRLEDKDMLKKEDISKLLNYLDPDQKGYVDFVEFSQKIRPNMAFDDENGRAREEKSKTSLFFMKPDTEKLLNSTVAHRKTMQNLKKGLEVDPLNIFTEKNTRFSGHPGWCNTFLKYQANSNSAMFISDEERFDRHRLASTKFQMDEKKKLQTIQEGRLEVKRENQKIIQEKIEKVTAELEAKDRAKLDAKYQRFLAYEQNARLRNNYA